MLPAMDLATAAERHSPRFLPAAMDRMRMRPSLREERERPGRRCGALAEPSRPTFAGGRGSHPPGFAPRADLDFAQDPAHPRVIATVAHSPERPRAAEVATQAADLAAPLVSGHAAAPSRQRRCWPLTSTVSCRHV